MLPSALQWGLSPGPTGGVLAEARQHQAPPCPGTPVGAEAGAARPGGALSAQTPRSESPEGRPGSPFQSSSRYAPFFRLVCPEHAYGENLTKSEGFCKHYTPPRGSSAQGVMGPTHPHLSLGVLSLPEGSRVLGPEASKAPLRWDACGWWTRWPLTCHPSPGGLPQLPHKHAPTRPPQGLCRAVWTLETSP